MTWAAILSSILKLFSAVAQYFRDKQLLDAGKEAARGEIARKNNEILIDGAKDRAGISQLTDDELDAELLNPGGEPKRRG